MQIVSSKFPLKRSRRLRSNSWIRDLVSENNLNLRDLIWPIFVREGINIREPISSLPDVQRLSIDNVLKEAQKAYDLGLKCIALFPCTPDNLKNELCNEAWNPDNLVNKATRKIKKKLPNLGVMLDVALDPYNSLGHDGLVKDGKVLNDETLDALEKQAVEHAKNGADILGPSDMMDGRIFRIRKALEKNNFQDTLIMSYSAKFASSFYGPFRDAVKAKGKLIGDKKTYQLDISNKNEAIREIALDLKEGADMILIKPGMPYLDICSAVKEKYKVPTFAYQVSGEYSMLMSAIQNNYLKKEETILESILCFKRAGCDGIVSYFAPYIANFLNK